MSKLTIEEIKNLINKIEENVSKKSLSEGDVQQLLADIDDGLIKVKKSAEGKQEVDEKVKELRSKVDNAISDEWGWGRVKGVLNEVKSGLEELKDKIISTEEPLAVGHGLVSSNALTFEQEREIGLMYNELLKWRFLFDGKTPDEVAKTSGNKKTETVNELFNGMHERGERWTTESADKLLPGLAGQIPGTKVVVGLVTGGISVASAAAAVGVHELDRTADNLKELTMESMKYANEAREGLKDTAERAGRGTRELIKEGIGKTAGVTESIVGIFNRKQRTESLEEKIKMLEQQLKEKNEQFEQRLEYRDKQIESKNEEIGDLRKRKDDEIKRLQEQLNSLQNKLIAQVEQKPVLPTSYGGKN